MYCFLEYIRNYCQRTTILHRDVIQLLYRDESRTFIGRRLYQSILTIHNTIDLLRVYICKMVVLWQLFVLESYFRWLHPLTVNIGSKTLCCVSSCNTTYYCYHSKLDLFLSLLIWIYSLHRLINEYYSGTAKSLSMARGSF